MKNCILCLIFIAMWEWTQVEVAFGESGDGNGKVVKGVSSVDLKEDTLKSKFQVLAEQWAVHCRSVSYLSASFHYINDSSYNQIVNMGKPVIPFVIERYKRDPFWGWGFMLEDITGLKVVKDKNRFNSQKVRKSWLEWWEKKSRAASHSRRR